MTPSERHNASTPKMDFVLLLQVPILFRFFFQMLQHQEQRKPQEWTKRENILRMQSERMHFLEIELCIQTWRSVFVCSAVFTFCTIADFFSIFIAYNWPSSLPPLFRTRKTIPYADFNVRRIILVNHWIRWLSSLSRESDLPPVPNTWIRSKCDKFTLSSSRRLTENENNRIMF